jgi:hypothetical protein
VLLGLIAYALDLMFVLEDGLDDCFVLVGQDYDLLLQFVEGSVDSLEIVL